jgi:ribose transport system substrate-binding protein
VKNAQEIMAKAENNSPPWTGPTSGPKIKTGSSVYVAIAENDLGNPGDSGFGTAVADIAKALGWKEEIFGSNGSTSLDISEFGQAVATHPTFIAESSDSIPAQTGPANLATAASEHIAIVGRHAGAEPGDGKSLGSTDVYWNIQPNTVSVGRLAGNCAVVAAAEFGKRAGIVIGTQNGLPITNTKSGAIAYGVQHFGGTLLQMQSYDFSEIAQLQPGYTSSSLEHFGSKLTAFESINDIYCDSTIPTLIAHGYSKKGLPVCIGAGDGSPAAFTRIRTHDYQIATVPDETVEQAFVAVDQFNNYAHGLAPDTFNPPVHITTYQDITGADTFDPTNNYRAIYAKNWGVSAAIAKKLEAITAG